GRDPIDLRRHNLLGHGEAFAPGDTPIDGKFEESLGRAAEAIGWTLAGAADRGRPADRLGRDRKSTRLNSSHLGTSYAVCRLKKRTATVIRRSVRVCPGEPESRVP